MSARSAIRFSGLPRAIVQTWVGPPESIAFDLPGILERLCALDRPCYAVEHARRIGLTCAGEPAPGAEKGGFPALASVSPLPPGQLGDASFRVLHGAHYAYATGAMANGIASEDLVIAMGRAGYLSSFGAAGLLPGRIESAIHRIRQALPGGPYAFNLIHSPSEPALEARAVDLYLAHGVHTVEASAYLDLTPHIVRYRAAGLEAAPSGEIVIRNRVIAKVSRREVARKFLMPAPESLLNPLVEQGHITRSRADLARAVPMADDITVEADSGGHTDNRPLVCLLPSMLALRDEIQAEYAYETPVRIGAAGGIGTPASALGAFSMGAAYVVTGSINQSCVEAGASEHTRRLLAQADMADVMMAPAADMFEMGVKLQVLKRGTFFPMRAQKLYDLYRAYESIDEIPPPEREKLEKQTFRRSLETVWQETQAYFNQRDPGQIERALDNPKRKMALIFRWYLGLSSSWSNTGEPGREVDYQIWCGPAMGAFNDWARGSYLEDPANRRVADLAREILTGAAFLFRVNALSAQGLILPAACRMYRPMHPPEPVKQAV